MRISLERGARGLPVDPPRAAVNRDPRRLAMLRVTQDVLEIRRWADAHHARPCRDAASGRLLLALAGEPCSALGVGWDEFEAAFLASRSVCVYDDSPGLRRVFVGAPDEAHRYVHGSGVVGDAAPA
jgi:hypothetical protein